MKADLIEEYSELYNDNANLVDKAGTSNRKRRCLLD